jgi:hypothetical protein
MVSPDALALVCFGLRGADDPRIVTRDTGLGLHVVDLPTMEPPVGEKIQLYVSMIEDRLCVAGFLRAYAFRFVLDKPATSRAGHLRS